MAKVDQRRINNQRSGFVGAAEAAELLGVKRATLYAYASRGAVRSLAGNHGRARRYALEDLQRLKARSDARRGHAAVASAALDWGEPVLDSAITRIDQDGPHYRGRSALTLARAGTQFEAVAALLWSGAHDPGPMPAASVRLERQLADLAALLPRGAASLSRLTAFVALAGASDPDRHAAAEHAVLAQARALLRAMACALGDPRSPRKLAPGVGARLRIAELAAHAFGVARAPHAARSLDQMLALCADHELNVSTFAVRVTASTGADLYACVGAGLCALSGPRHGGMCDRIEALIAACGRPTNARAFVRERERLGESIPGFGHPLYPAGDPRGVFLLARAYALGRSKRDVLVARALVRAMARNGHPDPTLDLGLVAMSSALGLPAGSAGAIFALGRTAGWAAHMLEQRSARSLLRPRARYVGVERGGPLESSAVRARDSVR